MKDRVRDAAWVSGTAHARRAAQAGSASSGKKVPQKRHIGITTRNMGTPRELPVEQKAAKHMPALAKANPQSAETGSAHQDDGQTPAPHSQSARSIAPEVRSDTVVPHRISPATTSSTESGVASIASIVLPWRILENEP